MRAFAHETPEDAGFTRISGKLEMGENCSHKGNFQAMKIGLVPKCSEEHSPVRGQGSRVRGQGSGVKTGVKYQDLGFLELFSRLNQLVTPILTPDHRPPTTDP